MTKKIYPVILSGGVGSRLWPLSREESPKQFVPLFNDKNLLQNTCSRYKNDNLFYDPIIVCNDAHRFQVAESIRGFKYQSSDIILEPCARNTAPAIALAAFRAIEKDPESIMLVSPSDHYIDDFKEITHIIEHLDMRKPSLYTFGIKPDSAETGYGYIKMGKRVDIFSHEVQRFIEKPDIKKANEYVKQGDFYWNSGMFLFHAKVYLEELKSYQPETYESCCQAYQKHRKDLDFIRVCEQSFRQCNDISIDYAVFEKTKNAMMIPLSEIQWSDVGSWGALSKLGNKDSDANIIKGDVCQVNSKSCYLHSHDRLIAAVDVDGLVVVETADAVLVANANSTQNVKAVVEKLKCDNRQETRKHKRHYGPWGYRDQLVKDENFLVNRVYFKKDAESSLQMHHYSRKYFTVLRGAARVMINGKEHLLSVGMSVSIAPLQRHQVFAIGLLPLEMIEIRSGSHISEDDIVRF